MLFATIVSIYTVSYTLDLLFYVPILKLHAQSTIVAVIYVIIIAR